MAPTAANDQPNPQPTDDPKSTNSWSTGAIVVAAIFGFLFIILVGTVIAFWYIKRKERSKLPPEHRRSSYHPFRTEASDKSGLLANQAPVPEDDKSSMFSRDRSRSSVSLYVAAEVDERRLSTENVSLIPLHITPVEEVHDPTSATASSGSGVSKGSRISLGLSPIQAGDSAGTSRPSGRPRSTSSTSMRYYSNSSPDNTAVPQVPKIVHTPSQ